MNKRLLSLAFFMLMLMTVLAGCDKNEMLSLLAIDINAYDPSTELAADVLQKTVLRENQTQGDFIYTVFTDDTASITGYTGTQEIVALPETVDTYKVIALDNKAIYNNQTVTELIFPDTLSYIGNYACMYCANLQKVTFGKEIKAIGVSAFESDGDDTASLGKGSLQTLVFKGSPEVINEKAFYYCDKLTEIVLPAGVKRIENWAFAKCFSADKILIGQGNEYIGDHAFLKCRKARAVSIPGSCECIDVSAFYQCLSLTDLQLGEGVKSLKKGAFEECSALKSVILPSTVQELGKYAFYHCTALAEVEGWESVPVIEKDVFTGTVLRTHF